MSCELPPSNLVASVSESRASSSKGIYHLGQQLRPVAGRRAGQGGRSLIGPTFQGGRGLVGQKLRRHMSKGGGGAHVSQPSRKSAAESVDFRDAKKVELAEASSRQAVHISEERILQRSGSPNGTTNISWGRSRPSQSSYTPPKQEPRVAPHSEGSNCDDWPTTTQGGLSTTDQENELVTVPEEVWSQVEGFVKDCRTLDLKAKSMPAALFGALAFLEVIAERFWIRVLSHKGRYSLGRIFYRSLYPRVGCFDYR